MTVPYQFANTITTNPLLELDEDLATPMTLGTTPCHLGDTITLINGLTLSNLDIASYAGNAATNGQLLIGDGTTNTFHLHTLYEGDNIVVNNGPGTITLSYSTTSTGSVMSNLITLTGSGSFDLTSLPANTNWIYVTVIGAGGGAFWQSRLHSESFPYMMSGAGGGFCSGPMSVQWFLTNGYTSIPYSVGAGGAANNSSDYGEGGLGGSSSFGVVSVYYWLAYGGHGGNWYLPASGEPGGNGVGVVPGGVPHPAFANAGTEGSIGWGNENRVLGGGAGGLSPNGTYGTNYGAGGLVFALDPVFSLTAEAFDGLPGIIYIQY